MNKAMVRGFNNAPRQKTFEVMTKIRFCDGYSEEWKLKTQAARLRSIINSGLGVTNKPISGKRMAKLKRNLAEIEAALNGC